MDIYTWLWDPYGNHWEGCEDAHIRCAISAELARLRTLVEKRERQIVWLLKADAEIIIPDGSYGGRFRWTGVDGLRYCHRWDGTDGGILAALDKATGEL